MCTYFEALLDHVALYFVEEIAVLLVDELVAVDAFRLVQIQADQVRHGLDRLWFGKQNALHIRHKRKLNKNIFDLNEPFCLFALTWKMLERSRKLKM